MPKLVLVEINWHGDVIRIFKFRKHAYKLPVESVREMVRADAVRSIRLTVWERSKDENGHSHCEKCGAFLTWETSEMNERLAKGKRGEDGNYGEVSLENCEWLCHDCHQGPRGQHGDRRWQTAKLGEP